jgi:serine/threonine protein kinase
VLLYQLLTGRLPFQGASARETLELVCSREPAPPRHLRPTVPLGLEAVCLRCLQKDSSRRYAGLRDLADALAPFAGDRQAPAAEAVLPADVPAVPGVEILNKLGSGSLNDTYRGRVVAWGRLVAVKMLRPEVECSPELYEQFRTVAGAMTRWHHPAIAQLYQAAELDGRPYVIMELVEGGNLATRWIGMSHSITQAVTLLREVAETIQWAHEKGVVHGNLRPSKVLLTWDGRPKITGFVLHVGAASYLAPEQLTGSPVALGPATDVYALGLLLYELLTGLPPFRAVLRWALIAEILQQQPEPPSQLRPEIPRNLDVICLRCLAKEPAQRYASARALADDLGRFLAGKPPQPLPAADEWVRTVLASTEGGPNSNAASVGLWKRVLGWLRRS